MTYITNDNYYLYLKNGDYSYWTMTPIAYLDSAAVVGDVPIDGSVFSSGVGSNDAVRPVVSLKSDAISGGVGTVNNPFYVDEKP